MIYPPLEDSYLLNDVLKRELPFLFKQNPNLLFLEIGAGSGIHLLTAKKLGIKKKNIFSSDIDDAVVKHCNSLGYNCIKSDLFEDVKGKYNLIIFNPPYLPEDLREPKSSRCATTGGKKGDEIIIRFLNQAKNHLNKKGRIFLLVSSLTPQINFKKLGYKSKRIGNKKLFFEELSVWELVI